MIIVSIAPYMPFTGIPHAGGEFYRRHVDLLSRSHDVLVICPRSSENEAAVLRDDRPPHQRLLLAPQRRVVFPGHRLLQALLSRVDPVFATRPFRDALRGDGQALAALRKADRIELQWFQAIVLAPMLRRLAPGVPLIGFFHDVVSQGHGRVVTARGAPIRRRVLALVRLLLARLLERRAMGVLHTAVVLSEKDRRLLRRRGGSARIHVALPPLDTDDMPRGPLAGAPPDPAVLFVGAFWRTENEDAALWLLDAVWPRIRAAVPGARLTIAGSGPSPALRRTVQQSPDVRLTGYVPSLTPYYESASVAVAPVRLGAGVKLKCVVAMLWGLPVVATRPGAEGLDEGLFLAVEDDPSRFAQAVVRALTDPSSTDSVRAKAHAWAHDTHSAARYLRTLEQIYR